MVIVTMETEIQNATGAKLPILSQITLNLYKIFMTNGWKA